MKLENMNYDNFLKVFEEDKVVGTVFIPLAINEENVDSIIVTCVEGGSNYWLGIDNTTPEWADKPKVPTSTWMTKILLEGGKISLYDREDEEERWELTLDKIFQGITKYAQKNSQFSLEDMDAEVADSILQYALFGEIVYG